MFERCQPADALWVVVEGTIQGFEEIGGQRLLVATTERGQVTGMLPFSRMTHYPRDTVAAEPSIVLRVPAEQFPEIFGVSHEIARRLVAQMSDRVRHDVRLEQQSERMVALGRLSAGLAHELNNPASAIRRAAIRLGEHRGKLPGLVTSLVKHHLDEAALRRLEQLRTSASGSGASGLSTMERGTLEDEVTEWLEEREVEGAWDIAPTLVEAGVGTGALDDLAGTLPDAALDDVLAWLAGGIEADHLVAEIQQAAGRISDLVASIKTYSHMDRSPEHKPTDVRSGLDNTVTMLGHKLKAKSIRLERDYQEDLPTVPANAGELNQVWTNLIDNAIDASPEGGTITLRARRHDVSVEVEVTDEGPGIPEEVRARIFEPFFTTKEVGVGTGLGLGIAQRIVRTHQGDIEIRSTPGRTVMCVRLPLAPRGA